MAVAKTSDTAAGARVEPKRSARDSWSTSSFILPAVLIILFLSIFPLLISLYVSVSRFQFVKGGFELTFVGFSNYAKLLVGVDQSRFLGKFGTPNWVGWLILGLISLAMVYWIVQYIRKGRVTAIGLAGRL